MKKMNRRSSSLPGRRQRKSVRLSSAAAVSFGSSPETGFVRVAKPAEGSVDLRDWAAGNLALIEEQLLAAGAVLFRGFGVDGVEPFRAVSEVFVPKLLDYQDRAAPRLSVAKGVYTSTEFPASQIIPLHHEMSYAQTCPTRLMFYCQQPPTRAGRTPVVEDRKIFGLIDKDLRQEFLRKKVMYVRNYGEGVDISWQEAFQTTEREVAEAFCKSAGMEVEWRGKNRLRTRVVRHVVADHPQTGERVWFNHAHLFHQSNLEPRVRAALLEEFDQDELPRNAFFGDGSPIDSLAMGEVRDLYERQAVRFDWQQSDLLLVDNFLVSHGREAFAGPRKIIVAMGQPHTLEPVN